jgi:hypothetical protein
MKLGLSLKFKFSLFAFGLVKTLSIVGNTPSVVDFELSILEVSHCFMTGDIFMENVCVVICGLRKIYGRVCLESAKI